MSSGRTTILQLACLLLLWSFSGSLALSVGQACSINVPNQCDSGLVCVAQGSAAHCRRAPCPATCPVLPCHSALQYTPQGQCCPTCLPPPTRTYIAPPSGCTVDGVHYNEGDSWKSDNFCTSCSCTDGQPLCSAIQCAPNCANPVQVEGECCPVCLVTSIVNPPVVVSPPQSSHSDVCIENGQEYQDGEDWRPAGADSCTRAHCNRGEILHESIQCEQPSCSDPVQLEDVCCPVCLRVSEGNEEKPPTTPPTCTLGNNKVLQSGESLCPFPNVTATCNGGVVEYTHHCPPLDCVNIIRGRKACDCPVCVDHARKFTVASRLRIDFFKYVFNASGVENVYRDLAYESGLHFDYVTASRCSNIMCFKIHVHSPDLSATETDVIEAVRKEYDSKSHPGLYVGSIKEIFPQKLGKRFARSVTDDDSASEYGPLSFSSSSSSSSSNDGNMAVHIAVGVSASLLGVVATVIGVALLTSYVHRKRYSRTTITV